MTPPAARIQTAQLADAPLYNTRASSAGSEAIALCQSAESHFFNGDYAQSALEYLELTQRFPNSEEALVGDRGLGRILANAVSGTVSLDAIAAFESARPAWNTLSQEAKYFLLGAYNEAVVAADGASNVAMRSRFLQPAHEMNWAFVHEHPNSPFIQSVLELYYATAARLGSETLSGVVTELRANLFSGSEQEPSTLGRFYRISAANALIDHHMLNDRRMDLVSHFSGMLAGLASDNFAARVMTDESIYAWVKGRYALAIGRACENIGQKEKALYWYELGQEHGPSGALTAHWLGYRAARMKAHLDPSNPAAGLQAYNDYLLRYDDNVRVAPHALMDMAGIYLAHGDYDQASVYYETVKDEYSDSTCAAQANFELEYIARYLEGANSVAERLDPNTIVEVQQAQLCGPYALQKLLALHGVDAELRDLALLAGTGPDGASMAGLAEAAAAKGLPLQGVEEKDPGKLLPPYIAHVDGNHFVLVKASDGSAMAIDQVDQPEASIPLADFAARWDGLALVPAQHTAENALKREQLANVWGGLDPGPPITIETGCKPDDGECHDGDCSLDEGATQGPQEIKPGSKCSGPGCNNKGGGVPLPPRIPYSGGPNSPVSTLAIHSPGVTNPRINNFTSAQQIQEEDLGFDTAGSMRVSFKRAYTNPHGFPTSYYTQMGAGWTHNYNNESSLGAGSVTISIVLFIDEYSSQYVELTQTTTVITPLGGAWTETYSDPGYHYDPAPGSAAATFPATYGYTLNGVLYTFERQGSATITLTYPDPVPGGGMSAGGNRIYRLVSKTDQTGLNISFTYDGSGRLDKVSAPSPDTRNLKFTYDGSSRISKVQLMQGTSTELSKVEYTYNGSGQLTRVTDHDGDYVDYAYGTDGGVAGSGYISRITDKAGTHLDFTFTYTNNGSGQYRANTITVENADGLVTVFERSHSTNISTNTNWDSSTQITKIVNTPLTGTVNKTASIDYYTGPSTYENWTFQYDGNKKLTDVLAPGSVSWAEYEYDGSGRLTDARHGAGPWTEYGYVSTNTYYTTVTGPDGLDTDFTYDGSLRLEKVEHPSIDAAGVQYDYDAYGQITKVTDPLGNETVYTYDSLGNLESVTDPELNETTFTYDAFGNVATVTDPRGKTAEFTMVGGGCGSCGSGGGLMTAVEDALGNITSFEYDVNGNMTKVTDALLRETDYEYDDMNRLVKIISPSGSANEMTFSYNILGQLESQTDFDGKTVSYVYDHMGRVTTVTDPEGSTTVAYNSDGTLASVTDGLSHTTSYTYDTAFRLTTVTDHIGKKVKYFYDAAGRMEKVGAGATGTTDPTEYLYSSTTGLMETVRYTSGANTYDADYYYDGAARLIKLTDWIDGTDGLQYEYDDAGRLTVLRDYDGEELTYAYDEAGNITSMTDYHGNTTTYTYTDLNQVDTITAPGSKVWDFNYNDLGQPTDYDHPNGMTTEYTYDTLNRLSKIDHKDGMTTKQSFEYTLTDGGNIERIEHEDGVYWEYEYDGRNRLISADRVQSANIVGEYDYTYDDGDNMLTRSEPFFDDFNDTNYTGWTVGSGTWSASNAVLSDTVANAQNDLIWKYDQDADDFEATYRYRATCTGGGLAFWPRHDGPNDIVIVAFDNTGTGFIRQTDASVTTYLDTNGSCPSTQNVWYNVRVVADGANITVWRWEDGDMPEEVLSTSSCTQLTSAQSLFSTGFWQTADIDDIRFTGSNLKTTTTFTCNNANELTSMTMTPGGTTTFTYDDWGRMTQKANGGYVTNLNWSYCDKLLAQTSNFPNQDDVEYDYDGLGRRRSRIAQGGTINYRYDHRWNVISIDNAAGALSSTFIFYPGMSLGPRLAEINGPVPGSGAVHYFGHDNLQSQRMVWDSARSTVGDYEFSPYGTRVKTSGFQLFEGFTAHILDHSTGLYYAPYRFYDPSFGRWISRDPLRFADGPNMYAYVRGKVTSTFDPFGLFIMSCGFAGEDAMKKANELYPWRKMETAHNNFMRHCFASCETARDSGRFCSWVLGDVREFWTNDNGEDYTANKKGRDCGSCPRFAELNCVKCCNRQYKDQYGDDPYNPNPNFLAEDAVQ